MATPDNLSAEMWFLINKELERDEEILWTGRPHALMYAKSLLPISLFIGLPPAGLMILILFLAREKLLSGWETQNMHIMVFSILMIGALILSISGTLMPFFVYRTTKKETYVLTNRRALIVQDISPHGIKLTNLVFRRLQSPWRISSRQRKDGYGDIIFEKITRYDGESLRIDEKAFYCLPDIKNVEREINFLSR